MSPEDVLTRMVNDPDFAEAVFANVEKTLAEYNLSAEELAKFKSMSRAEFTSLVTEDRKSMASLPRPDSPTGPDYPNHNQTMLTVK